MSLLRFDNVSLDFGDRVILREASLAIEPDERVCLVGRNGTGKTTLLRLITGAQQPDHGEIEFRDALRVSQLQQALPAELDETVREYVTTGLAELQAMVSEFQRLADTSPKGAELRELEQLQLRIDGLDGWRIDQRVDTICSELELPQHKRLGELSGGWRRRVGLARALVSDPELLLLDEPTNHLDLAAIDWLEGRVRAFTGSVVFVTHDRVFLQRLATRILELDRGQLVSWPGSYRDYLRRKSEALDAEQRANREFDKKLAGEEAWIRQGVKARRTRNEGRVRALEAMREEREARIDRPRDARINIDEAVPSGRKVIRARNVSYGYGDTPLIRDLDLQIVRGDRIGLVGNNGVGKSTLLKLLLGELKPQTGTVKLGTQIELGYYDPLHGELDPEKSVADNVGEGRDYVQLNGKDVHVIGYLRGFLFEPKRAMTPVKILSGGERNRVLLARMFTRPSNLLVLDEPTNDLDIETLAALETRLREYRGTLIVASHDREFLDNVVTSILAFEADGVIRRYVGGYSDWARLGHRLEEADRPSQQRAQDASAEGGSDRKRPTKLSYREQRELDGLPARIEALERDVAALQDETTQADFYSADFARVQETLARLQSLNRELEAAVERWAELEEQQLEYRQR
jgi:ATP-binding cassette subfamily F protein uup